MKEGDIVQITDEQHPWYPALIIVTELKGWGVMGYALIVTNDETPNGQAYIRIKNEQYEPVGHALVVAK